MIRGIHINIELPRHLSFVKFGVSYREEVTEFQGSTWHSCLTATCHKFDSRDLPVTFIMWPLHLNEFWAYKCPTLCFCFLKSVSFTLLWPPYFSSYELTLHKSLFCLIVFKTPRIVEEIFGRAVYILLFFVTFMQNSFLWQRIFVNYALDVHKNVLQSSCLKCPLFFAILMKIYLQISQELPNMRFLETHFHCSEHTKNNYCDRGNKM